MDALKEWLELKWFTIQYVWWAQIKNYFDLNAQKEPRQYALVRFAFEQLPEGEWGYPFSKDHRYIFLGEIPNMGGHCIVMDDKGKHYVGFHTENFVELSEEPDEDGIDDLDRYVPVGMKPWIE